MLHHSQITADSPFIDPSLIDYGIKLYKTKKYEIVMNTYPRSFPKGQSFSIYNAKVFVNNLKNVKKIIKSISHLIFTQIQKNLILKMFFILLINQI